MNIELLKTKIIEWKSNKKSEAATKLSNESQEPEDLKQPVSSDHCSVPGLLTKPSLALIDIQSQPMTILNSLNIVKQEKNIPQT